MLKTINNLCFSGRWEKQDGRPGLWLAETFSTSPLKPLNGIQWNLTGSKISMSSTKFVFFGPIKKTRWPPWPLIGWDIFNFSSETVEGNSSKHFRFLLWNRKRNLTGSKFSRKQVLNVLYQVCVFQANQINKMAVLSNLSIKVAHCTQVQDMWLFGPLVCLVFTSPAKWRVELRAKMGHYRNECFEIWNLLI